MNNQTFVLTDGSMNSYGFRIAMDKLRLERFRSNPVMLYNHGELVGRWENLRMEDGRLLGDPVYMEDEQEQLSLKIKKRVENGFIKGVSVGIRVLSHELDEEDIPVVEAEVYECSLCVIPSNQHAIVLYDEEGLKLEGEPLSLALGAIKEVSTKKEKNTNNTMKLNDESYKTLGINADASSEVVDRAILTLKQEKDALQGKLDAIREERVKTLIDKGLTEGKFMADKKELYEKLARTDFELAKTTIADLPGKKTLAGKEQPFSHGGDDRNGWMFDDWRKNDMAGLLAIKQSEPERYEELIKK